MADQGFPLHVVTGQAPPGPVRLYGGPMDGTYLPSPCRTPWIATRWPETEVWEWYAAIALDATGAAVYSHVTIRDDQLNWSMILGYSPPDEGDEPYVTV